LTYHNKVQATEELVGLLRRGGRITKTSESLLCDSGLPYYFVEVTLEDGSQYALQAYEKEAVSLYERTERIMRAERLTVIPGDSTEESTA
jgi:hypothetical protein